MSHCFSFSIQEHLFTSKIILTVTRTIRVETNVTTVCEWFRWGLLNAHAEHSSDWRCKSCSFCLEVIFLCSQSKRHPAPQNIFVINLTKCAFCIATNVWCQIYKSVFPLQLLANSFDSKIFTKHNCNLQVFLASSIILQDEIWRELLLLVYVCLSRKAVIFCYIWLEYIPSLPQSSHNAPFSLGMKSCDPACRICWRRNVKSVSVRLLPYTSILMKNHLTECQNLLVIF